MNTKIKSMLFLSLTLTAFLLSAYASAEAQYARLHEGSDNNGAYEDFGGENIYLDRPNHTSYMNNKASSITVGEGLFVNLCDRHPQREQGDPSCGAYPEGKYRIVSLDKRVSYINVQRPKSSPEPKSVACLYTGFNGIGTQRCYNKSGEFSLLEEANWYGYVDKGVSPAKLADTVSSIWIAPNCSVTVGKLVLGARGSMTGVTKKYGAGMNNLSVGGFNNSVTTIKIERLRLMPDDIRKLPSKVKVKATAHKPKNQ